MMPILLAASLVLALAITPAAAGWGHRVVVIEAPAADDPDLVAQTDVLLAQADALRERDMAVFARVAGQPLRRLFGEAPASEAGASAGSPARFTIVLRGKDGGEKLRSTSVVSAEDLFGLVDTMPMRRQEMKHRGGQGS